MQLNLGCGNRKLSGWINVDKYPACNPDQVADLESLPWPWPDDSVDEVLLSHVLEHLGAATDVYLGIFKELYRVCRDGASVSILVPHPRHDFFLNDPTHVRPITPDGLAMFSQAANRQWIAERVANTPLAIYLGIDFTTDAVNIVLDEHWRGLVERKEVSAEDLADAARHSNNVIAEYRIVLKAVKPAGKQAAT
jgi:SAM-dependent methyltransferase